jgi:hypothetical protein
LKPEWQPAAQSACSQSRLRQNILVGARKIGGTTVRSIGHIGRLQRILDNDADFVTPSDMLAELRDDNRAIGDEPARNARPVR